MDSKKIALLMDVDNVKISGDAFEELYKKLNNVGEVVYCKFYGYNDRKHIYLSDVIAKYGYETAPFMRFKKRFSQLDTRIIVDAVALNYSKPEINTFCIVAGDGDLIPLLVELKSSGKSLIDINTPYQEQNTHMFDMHMYVGGMDGEVDAYKPKTTKKPKAATAPKAKAAPKRVAKPVVYEEVEEYTPYVAPAPAPAPVYAPVEEVEEYETSELSERLNDITSRYGELDFSNNSDMDKKLQLISDIESLIHDETAKGEGLNSDDADVRQIFVELQSIAEDMKSAL